MIEQAAPQRAPSRVLEPACGLCPFLEAFAQCYGLCHECVAIDVNPENVRLACQRFPHLTVLEDDFLLWKSEKPFDLILGNPPYGIVGDASHYPIHVFKERKTLYKRLFSTWRGKYNLYGAFIEHSMHLLAQDGRLVFVVPASWLVLDDFVTLRRFLARSGSLRVYYLGKAFPGRNVSVVVLVVQKGEHGLWLHDGTTLALERPIYHGELIRFETPDLLAFERSGVPLEELFDIHFAARSSEIRQHPLVVQEPQKGTVPVLTGRNLKAGWIDYETASSRLWMPHEAAPSLRSFYGFPHIVVGHTKGARVVAALDERCYPWREEFHLVSRVSGLNLTAIVQHLNSEPVQKYVHALYRDFVPHLTMTELKKVPIPEELAGTRGV